MLCFGSNLIETYLSLIERLTKTFSFDFINIRTWLSLVERLLWEQDAAGSNPVVRTISGCLIGFENSIRQPDSLRYLNPLLTATAHMLPSLPCGY